MQKTVDSMGNSLDLVFADICELLLKDAPGSLEDDRLAAGAIPAHPPFQRHSRSSPSSCYG